MDYPDSYRIVPNQKASSSSEPESVAEFSDELSLVMSVELVVWDSTSCFGGILDFFGLETGFWGVDFLFRDFSEWITESSCDGS